MTHRPHSQAPYRRASWIGALLFSSLLVTGPLLLAADEESIIERGDDVSIEYTLSTKDQGVINSNVGKDPFVYTQGMTAIECMGGLQEHLAGLRIGEKLSFVLPPEEGCGAYDPDAILELEIGLIPPESRKIGRVIRRPGPHKTQLRAKIKDITDEMVILDLNHPLAGKTLYFEVTILDIVKSSSGKNLPPKPGRYRQ